MFPFPQKPNIDSVASKWKLSIRVLRSITTNSKWSLKLFEKKLVNFFQLFALDWQQSNSLSHLIGSCHCLTWYLLQMPQTVSVYQISGVSFSRFNAKLCIFHCLQYFSNFLGVFQCFRMYRFGFKNVVKTKKISGMVMIIILGMAIVISSSGSWLWPSIVRSLSEVPWKLSVLKFKASVS